MNNFCKISLTLVSALVAQGALAVHPGTSLVNGSFTHPYTGEPTDAWKLVGTMSYPAGGMCSAVQVSREWVIATRHCSLETGVVFRNQLSIDPAGSPVTCKESDEQNVARPQEGPLDSDMTMCRLDFPDRFALPSAYPAIGPHQSALGEITPRALGRQMSVGYGSDDPARDRLGRAAIGTRVAPGPFCETEDTFFFEPRCSLRTEDGDSGGGIYWYSPHNPQPTYVGVLGGSILNQILIDWIKVRTTKYSRLTPPTFATFDQAFGRPVLDAPRGLARPPVVKLVGQQVVVSWTTALQPGEVVDDFFVQEGPISPLALERAVVALGTARTLSFTGVAAGQRKVCVSPRRMRMQAMAAQDLCVQYENYKPIATNVLLQTKASTSTIKTVSLVWGVSDAVGLTRYKVSYTITSPAGSKRSGVTDVAATSVSLGLIPLGHRVCSSVTAYTPNFDGQATSQCAVVQ